MRSLIALERLARPLIHWRARATRGLTLGVRGLVEDSQGRICLVRHTYMPGWYMPGGGIERGETAHAALARELVEEAGVELTAPARLLSVHDNRGHFRGDHVLIYRATTWRATAATQRGEIAELGWFARDALPPGATPATRARLREAFDGAPVDPFW